MVRVFLLTEKDNLIYSRVLKNFEVSSSKSAVYVLSMAYSLCTYYQWLTRSDRDLAVINHQVESLFREYETRREQRIIIARRTSINEANQSEYAGERAPDFDSEAGYVTL